MNAETLWLTTALAGGYLFGSLPFGLILTRLAGLGDLRRIGSGNIGATNVLRTGHRGLAAATLLLDGGKGALAVLCAVVVATAANLEPADGPIAVWLPLTAGTGAVVGHSFPIWLRFRGGKGVATTLGTLLAAVWPVGIAACALWLSAAALWRISSLAALIAIGAGPLIAWAIAGPPETVFTACLAALVFLRHRSNIARLCQGNEPRFHRGRKKEPTQ